MWALVMVVALFVLGWLSVVVMSGRENHMPRQIDNGNVHYPFGASAP